MNYLYSLLFDFSETVVFVGFCIGCCGVVCGFLYLPYYEKSSQITLISAFILIICFLLSVSQLDEQIIQTPQQTHFYLFSYQGKNKGVAFCFEAFDRQNEMNYADFMPKCLAGDWVREQYRQMVK